MRNFIFAVLVLAAASASAADSFEHRVAVAKKLEDAPDGQAYDRVLYGAIGNYIQKAMVECFPDGVTRDTSSFTLVADILANGTATRIEVRPETKMAACFGDKFAGAPFPALPTYAGADGLPIFIDMKITN
ncbi:hypothetical protein SAMN05216570_3412 [Dyella sp. OK004]|uniref:hypothetical protein n=1 Tax=Dyella sp. OK004 TaxID=1855292 RepID=UPI0008ED6CD6|nr:hypothetical protein [Dyella sp. OK004]SFS16902.1 hypothetical protein SAMN05216570_3412 [Dyella sp. OK004]